MRGLLLAVLLGLAACAPARLTREAGELVEAGRPFPAAMHYLDALDINPKHKKAREGLGEVAKAAYEARLAAAKKAEDEEKWTDALGAYKEVRRLLERLEQHGGVRFDTIDVAERIDAMENAAAEAAYHLGMEHYAAKRFESAIAQFKKAQGYKAGFRDSEKRIADVWFAWGDSDQAAGAWRDAAGRFIEAQRAGNTKGAARAGAIYLALGKAFLATNECRQSVRDLRAARDLVGTAVVKSDLEKAEACAATPVAIVPFDDASRARVSLAGALTDALGAAVRKDATDFVKLLEREAVYELLAEQKLTATKASKSGKLPGANWLVVGRIDDSRVQDARVGSSPRSVLGRLESVCERTTPEGQIVQDPCVIDVPLRYVEYAGTSGARMRGAIRVLDARTGVQSAIYPFDVTQSDNVLFVDGFVGPDGRPVGVRPFDRGGPEVGIPGELYQLLGERRELVSEAELARRVVSTIAAEAAKATLNVVDYEAKATDPVKLTIKPM